MTLPEDRPRVLIALNSAWNLVNFRVGLIRGLMAAGYEVVLAAPSDTNVDKLRALGCRFVPLPMDGHGTSVVSEIALCLRFWRLLRAERPKAYLGYTVKPNTYGSALAALSGAVVINNISGLGSPFLRGGWLAWLVQRWYWLGLYRSSRVFFQNSEDRNLFVNSGLVQYPQVGLLPGSGVDLRHFSPAAARGETVEGVCFLLMARLLRDKGVVEFVEAARSLRARYPHARFQLLGALDEGNGNAIPRANLQAWVDQGWVDYLGNTDDVRSFLARADCVVLPSYREGTSRALLEAAAMARPLIATDVPGCREALDDGVTGLLCRVKDVTDLAAKMAQFIEMAPRQRAAMGAAGRWKMEREFDEALVINAYLAELVRLGVHGAPRPAVAQ